MRVDLLQELVDKLRSLPPERFNFSEWVGDDWAGKSDLSCGTAACALGWATTIPSIKALGLKLYKLEKPIRNTTAFVAIAGETDAEDNALMQYEISLNAAMKVFNLSFDEAEYLFAPDKKIVLGTIGDKSYILKWGPEEDASADDVADHIEYFIAKKQEYETDLVASTLL